MTSFAIALALLGAPETDLDKAREHWAFRPVREWAVPAVRDVSWPSSPIDAFILARLEGKGLEPAPPADPHTLLRRVYFDLIGLPPTPEAIRTFVADPSPLAFERVVDRLLGRARFGERWARHWLDLVRFTETAGHVQDMVRPHAWRYRDYVIESLDRDLPYDRFVLEHLAGDLLDESDASSSSSARSAAVATGFLWFHEMHFRPVDPGAQRADQLEAQIDVVGKTFLALTVACARCHDHKFDAITQRDYYALAGIFGGAVEGHARLAPRSSLPADEERSRKVVQKEEEIRKLIEQQTASVRARQSKKTAEKLPLTEINFDLGAQGKLAKLRAELAKLDPGSALWAPAARAVQGRDIRLHIGGDHRNLGELVPRRFLSVLGAGRAPELGSRSGRLYLAKRIVASDNPLTARVLVNRLWQHVFGEGIVRTPNNFGVRGERPSHPQLLDFLARRLVESGWSIKATLRSMFLSRTYGMSSVNPGGGESADPENRLLHRFRLRRLEAETIRDALLAVPGSLDRAAGGPSIPPHVSPNATAVKPIHIPKSGPVDGDRRRSVYVLVRRNFVTPFLKSFDFPDQGSSVGRRNSTVVPSQALARLNSPLVHLQARRWGEAIRRGDGEVRDRITNMFLAAIGRPPKAEELATLVAFLAEQRAVRPDVDEASRWADVGHVLFNLNEFIFLR